MRAPPPPRETQNRDALTQQAALPLTHPTKAKRPSRRHASSTAASPGSWAEGKWKSSDSGSPTTMRTCTQGVRQTSEGFNLCTYSRLQLNGSSSLARAAPPPPRAPAHTGSGPQHCRLRPCPPYRAPQPGRHAASTRTSCCSPALRRAHADSPARAHLRPPGRRVPRGPAGILADLQAQPPRRLSTYILHSHWPQASRGCSSGAKPAQARANCSS